MRRMRPVFRRGFLETLVHDKDIKFDDRALPALTETWRELSSTVAIIGLCQDPAKLHPRVASLFLHHLAMPTLTLEDRRQLLTWLVERSSVRVEPSIDWARWAYVSA